MFEDSKIINEVWATTAAETTELLIIILLIAIVASVLVHRITFYVEKMK